MPLPDEYAVRLPPPPLSQERLWRGHGGVGQGGAGVPRKPGGPHALPLRPPWGLPAPVPPPPPSASVSHCPYMQGCVHAFLVQTCLCA